MNGRRVEPVLYQQIDLLTLSVIGKLARTLNEHPTKRAGFFADSVKDLALIYYWDAHHSALDATSAVVRGCPGVTRLAIQLQSTVSSGIGDQATVGQLATLMEVSTAVEVSVMVPLRFFPENRTSLSDAFFQNLTHLGMIWMPSYTPQGGRVPLPQQLGWAHLISLRRLTHFCLFIDEWWDADLSIAEVARVLPAWLQVFMVFVRWPAHSLMHMEGFSRALTESDIRAVTCTHEHTWQCHPKGSWLKLNTVTRVPGSNALDRKFWSKAEQLVEDRKRGLVQVCFRAILPTIAEAHIRIQWPLTTASIYGASSMEEPEWHLLYD